MNIRFDYPMGMHDLEKVSQSYMKLLIEAGHTVLLHPMVLAAVEQSIGRQGLDVLDPEAKNWDAIIGLLVDEGNGAEYLKEDKPVFLLTSWLADTIPATWEETVQGVAGVIVPSEKIAQAYEKVQGANGIAIPMPVFPKRVPEPKHALPKNMQDKDYAVAVGIGHELDNFELIVRPYYEKEAGKNDKRLALYVTNPIAGYPGAALDAISEVKSELNFRDSAYPEVRIYDGTEEYGAQRVLTDNARAVIVLSMADAWGIGIYTALATGRPVITTGMRLELGGLITVATSTRNVKDCPEFGLDSRKMKWDWPDTADVGAHLKDILYDDEKYKAAEQLSASTYSWIESRFKSDSERLSTWIMEASEDYVSSHTTNEPEVG
jgi:hypothetical protein